MTRRERIRNIRRRLAKADIMRRSLQYSYSAVCSDRTNSCSDVTESVAEESIPHKKQYDFSASPSASVEMTKKVHEDGTRDRRDSFLSEN